MEPSLIYRFGWLYFVVAPYDGKYDRSFRLYSNNFLFNVFSDFRIAVSL